MFYQRLYEYIKFYKEIKPLLSEECKNDELIKIKIDSLPGLIFKDYDNPFTLKTFFYSIGYILFFPVGILFLYNMFKYVSIK